MKKFKRMLAGLACVLAVCLCTPTAFAAKVIVYFDANGGTCTSAAERTNDEDRAVVQNICPHPKLVLWHATIASSNL